MRGTALAMGIVGGVIGIIVGFIEGAFGLVGHALGAEGGVTLGHLSGLAFIAAVAGIVGGALALRFSLVAWILMILACIAGFIAASAFWIPAGIFLFVGALLSFLAWFNRRKPQTGGIASA